VIKIGEDDINPNIVINWTNQGGGHFIMTELDSEWGEAGSRLNICAPQDIERDDKFIGSKNEERLAKRFEILTEAGCRWAFAKGSPSRHRNIVMYVPPNFDIADEEFKKTKFYTLVRPLVDEIESKRIQLNSYKELVKGVESALTDLISLDFPEAQLIKVKQHLDAIQSMAKEEKKHDEKA